MNSPVRIIRYRSITVVCHEIIFAVQYIQCIHDDDVDEMIWWPPDIETCTGKKKEMMNGTLDYVTVSLFSRITFLRSLRSSLSNSDHKIVSTEIT